MFHCMCHKKFLCRQQILQMLQMRMQVMAHMHLGSSALSNGMITAPNLWPEVPITAALHGNHLCNSRAVHVPNSPSDSMLGFSSVQWLHMSRQWCPEASLYSTMCPSTKGAESQKPGRGVVLPRCVLSNWPVRSSTTKNS